MDKRQRELERKASAGDVEAEAKLLQGRVRSGELSEDRLRLGARLGDGLAQRLYPTEALPGLDWQAFDEGELLEQVALVEAFMASERRMYASQGAWTQALVFDRESAVRASIPLARRLQGFFTRLLPHDSNASSAIEAAEAWTMCPCVEHAALAKAVSEALRASIDSARAVNIEDAEYPLEQIAWPVLASKAGRVARDLAALPSGTRPLREAAEISEQCLRALVHEADERVRDHADDMPGPMYTTTSGPQERRSIQHALASLQKDELLPWALGTGDPVRDRVEARRQVVDDEGRAK